MFCLQSITPFLIVIILLVMIWMFFKNYTISPISHDSDKIVIVNNPPAKTDSFNDLYSPPLKSNSYFFPPMTNDLRSPPPLPVNVESQRSYSQIGIITRNDENKEKLILPLMGRLLNNRRDKWQYYTVSNTGTVNTKLPIRFKGRSCSNEMGCDEIFNNDSMYVEGYKETFSATIYENASFSYNPL